MFSRYRLEYVRDQFPRMRLLRPGAWLWQISNTSVSVRGHSKRHSISPTDHVHERHTADRESISEWSAELAINAPALAWQARGRRFESAMLHQNVNSELALRRGECQEFGALTTKLTTCVDPNRWSPWQVVTCPWDGLRYPWPG